MVLKSNTMKGHLIKYDLTDLDNKLARALLRSNNTYTLIVRVVWYVCLNFDPNVEKQAETKMGVAATNRLSSKHAAI